MPPEVTQIAGCHVSLGNDVGSKGPLSCSQPACGRMGAFHFRQHFPSIFWAITLASQMLGNTFRSVPNFAYGPVLSINMASSNKLVSWNKSSTENNIWLSDLEVIEDLHCSLSYLKSSHSESKIFLIIVHRELLVTCWNVWSLMATAVEVTWLFPTNIFLLINVVLCCL